MDFQRQVAYRVPSHYVGRMANVAEIIQTIFHTRAIEHPSERVSVAVLSARIWEFVQREIVSQARYHRLFVNTEHSLKDRDLIVPVKAELGHIIDLATNSINNP